MLLGYKTDTLLFRLNIIMEFSVVLNGQIQMFNDITNKK